MGFTSNGVASKVAFQHSTDVSHLGFWRSIIPFGSEQKAEPSLQAFYEFDQALTTFSTLHQSVQIHPNDRRRLLELRDEVISIELSDLLTKHYPPLNEAIVGSRTLSFSGDWVDSENYQVSLGPLKSLNSNDRMGRLSADFSLSKGALSKDSAVFTSLLSMSMSTLLFKEMLDSWEVFHRELEHYADVEVDAPWSVTSASEAPLFDIRDQLILDKINENAPTVLSLINRLVTIDNVVDHPVDKFGYQMMQINLTQTLNLDVLKRHYTQAYGQYGPILEHVSFSTNVVTIHGKQIAVFHYDAETKVFSFKMTVSEGGIVLTDSNGEPTPEIIYPTKLKTLDYSINNDIFIDIFGLKIYIDQLTMNSQYLRTESGSSEQASVNMALNQLPKIRVEGALLHFVPPWLIDALIPGTIESMITEALSEAVNGRSGEGANIVFEFNEDKGQHQFSAGLSVELRYQLLQDLLSEIEDTEKQAASNEEDQPPSIFKDLGGAIRKDFDALLLQISPALI